MKGHSAHSNQPTTALPRFRVGRLRGVVAMLSLCVGLGASAQATDLIISEYIEGSSNNKYIEIYNGTGASVNLANYQLLLYANGSATISTTGTPAMTGMLADGATVVYKNSGAALAFVGAIVNSAVSYNGDDAIVQQNLPCGFRGHLRKHWLLIPVQLGLRVRSLPWIEPWSGIRVAAPE